MEDKNGGGIHIANHKGCIWYLPQGEYSTFSQFWKNFENIETLPEDTCSKESPKEILIAAPPNESESKDPRPEESMIASTDEKPNASKAAIARCQIDRFDKEQAKEVRRIAKQLAEVKAKEVQRKHKGIGEKAPHKECERSEEV